MDELWEPIETHPRSWRLFVVGRPLDGDEDVRLVRYDSEDDCFIGWPRRDVYDRELFTHWCCLVPHSTEVRDTHQSEIH